MKTLTYNTLIALLILTSCSPKDRTEIHHKKRDKIINVQDKIVDIKTDIIFNYSVLKIIDDILLVCEALPKFEKGIHLFNKNTFEYITSTGILGKGPGEISRIGETGINKEDRTFWISDHGKKLVWEFSLDSALSNPNFKPTENIPINYDLFLTKYELISDSIGLGKAVTITEDRSFIMSMVRMNFNTNLIQPYGYEHPLTTGKKSRSYFSLSKENGIYANAYIFEDLITICDIDGQLKYNIYGPEWNNNPDNKKEFYSDIHITSKYIIAAYLNDKGIIKNNNNNPEGNLPTKLLVFDLQGNYIKTLETGHKITFFCMDEENNRIVLYFDDREYPLGYLELK